MPDVELSPEEIQQEAENLVRELCQAWLDNPDVESMEAEEFERHGYPTTLAKDDGKGRWITIGAKASGDGKKHGGSPVYVVNGRITKGHPRLVGDKLGKEEKKERMHVQGTPYKKEGDSWINEEKPEYKASDATMNRWKESGKATVPDEDKEPSHRQQLSSSRDYAKAVIRKQARKEGIDPKGLDSLADDIRSHDKEYKADIKAIQTRARNMSEGLGYGTLKGLKTRTAKGIDYDDVKGLDDIAANLAASPEFSHLLSGDPEQKLFDILAEGNPEPMTEEEAYSEALDHLRNRGEPKHDPGTDDYFQPGTEQSTLYGNALKPLVPDKAGGTVSEPGEAFKDKAGKVERPKFEPEAGAEKPPEESPLLPEEKHQSIAESGAAAEKSVREHDIKMKSLADTFPDGTKVGGWTKITVAGDVFWQKGKKTVTWLHKEIGSQKVIDATKDKWNPKPTEEAPFAREPEPAQFDRPSYLTVTGMIDRLKRLGPSNSDINRELIKELRAILLRFPDLRRHISGADWAWMQTAVVF
jgi:hypothetical protein